MEYKMFIWLSLYPCSKQKYQKNWTYNNINKLSVPFFFCLFCNWFFSLGYLSFDHLLVTCLTLCGVKQVEWGWLPAQMCVFWGVHSCLMDTVVRAYRVMQLFCFANSFLLFIIVQLIGEFRPFSEHPKNNY